MELERQQQEQQEVAMMMMMTTEPDDEVNAGKAARRRNEPDEFISEFHRLLNLGSVWGYCRSWRQLRTDTCYMDPLSARGKECLLTTSGNSSDEKCNPLLEDDLTGPDDDEAAAPAVVFNMDVIDDDVNHNTSWILKTMRCYGFLKAPQRRGKL